MIYSFSPADNKRRAQSSLNSIPVTERKDKREADKQKSGSACDIIAYKKNKPAGPIGPDGVPNQFNLR